MMYIVLLCVFAAWANADRPKLGTLVPLCSRSDPNLNECVKKSAQMIFPKMVKGIPEYQFVSLDPLKLDFLEVNQDENPVGLKLNITESSHFGFTEMQIKDLNLDLVKHHWEVDVYFPFYSIIGNCHLGGQIMVLPIHGQGSCNLTADCMPAKLMWDGNVVKKNGGEHFTVEKFHMDMNFTAGYFHIEGLFGGNNELGTKMNQFLNDNGLAVLMEMKPTLVRVWSKIYHEILESFFDSVPYDEIFLP